MSPKHAGRGRSMVGRCNHEVQMKVNCVLLLLVGMVVAGVALGQEQLPPGFDPARHMRVSEVKEGMKGYGLSVFKGTKIERFEVEVMSVLRNFSPKDHVVLVRLKGANLEHTGAVAGMSGSPVFLKDEQGRERMIGAFAYGWPLMKDPLGGVQPIEYMLGMQTEGKKVVAEVQAGGAGAAKARGQMKWSVEEAMPVPWKKGAPKGYPLAGWYSSKVNPMFGVGDDGMRLRPLATPLMVTGLPPRVFEQFEPVMRGYGLLPLQAGGAGVTEGVGGGVKLEPGCSLAVPLVSGDMDLTVVGTCTEVLGDRVLGFGHAFMNEGEISLPMSSGYILGVIANLQTSFKLGAAGQLRGTLTGDQYCGVIGRIGPWPATAPIEVRCIYADGSVDQTYRFNAAFHPRLTAVLATMAMSAATTSVRDLPQYHTVDYDLVLEFANGESLKLKNRSTSGGMAEMFMLVGVPVMAAAENPFERVRLKKLSGTVRVMGEARQAEILSVNMPKSKYKPGETMKAFVRYRPFRSEEVFLPLEFELPASLADGVYDFGVTDWQQHLATEEATKPFRFTAQSGREVFEVLREMLGGRHDALYLRLMKQGDGVAIGRTAMGALPSSRRKVMMGAGLSNTTAFVSSTVKVVPTEYVMSGGAHFAITIDRELKVEGEKRQAGRRELPGQGRMVEVGGNRGVVRPNVPGGIDEE